VDSLVEFKAIPTESGAIQWYYCPPVVVTEIQNNWIPMLDVTDDRLRFKASAAHNGYRFRYTLSPIGSPGTRRFSSYATLVVASSVAPVAFDHIPSGPSLINDSMLSQRK